MKSGPVFLSLVSMAVLCGCRGRELPAVFEYDPETIIIWNDLKSDRVVDVSDFITSDLVGLPLEMVVTSEYVVSVDISDSTVLRWYSLHNPVENGDIGTKGRGPGEFTRPWSLHAIYGADIGILDAALRTFSVINVESLEVSHQRTLSIDGLPLQIVAHDQETGDLTTGGVYSEFRFITVDSTGRVVSNRLSAQGGSGQYVAHPDGAAWAVALENFDIIEISDSTGHIKSVTYGPRHVPGTGESGGGFRAIAAQSDAIFALLENPDYDGGSAVGHELVVIDWNGQPLRSVTLQGEYYHITIDPAGEYLYASKHSPYPSIDRISVQDLLP